MSKDIEESEELNLDFRKLEKAIEQVKGVIVAVAQDLVSKEVLIIGFINRAALDYSIKYQTAAFWSTSRNELWVKGKTSGEYLELVDIFINCEQNSVLYKVKISNKGACHTKNKEGSPRKSCFYRKIKDGKLLFTEK
ncbi:MAG: phosphoribosyl-AMP cyclohydrolase [Spirochaetia bacterium]|nr:phosphoribosyl-AMP cyclohydrolase [Spirochaetia bacterium]